MTSRGPARDEQPAPPRRWCYAPTARRSAAAPLAVGLALRGLHGRADDRSWRAQSRTEAAHDRQDPMREVLPPVQRGPHTSHRSCRLALPARQASVYGTLGPGIMRVVGDHRVRAASPTSPGLAGGSSTAGPVPERVPNRHARPEHEFGQEPKVKPQRWRLVSPRLSEPLAPVRRSRCWVAGLARTAC